MNLAARLSRLTAAPTAPFSPTQENGKRGDFADLVSSSTRRSGPLFLARRVYSREYVHGRAPINRARGIDASTVAALAVDPALATVDFSRLLLLDTETTGLSGGTGTLPFLIGLGGFSPDGALVLDQMFLRRPGEERPMLEELAERVARASCLVTYNGKAFDWPLLRARYIMNRLTPPPIPLHLDLLHCARRIFRHRGIGARLCQIESQVLGHSRPHDVPGSAIPELYFAFLRGGALKPMQDVLEHNANDLVLLVALLGELAERFQAPRPEDDARDLLGCAEVALRMKAFVRAEQFALAAVAAPAHPFETVRARAWTVVAHARWKRGRRAETVEALLAALETAPRGEQASIRLSLAKLYEHFLKDPRAALAHARQAASSEPEVTHQRRIARLERRQSKGEKVPAQLTASFQSRARATSS